MRFMVTFAWKPDPKTRNEGIGRFKTTGGLPPQGAKLVGRWTRADFSGGYVLLESDDSKALAAFAHNWGDLMELSIVPVVDDEELAQVLQRVGT
jgi:hypothetical protein